MGGKKLFFRIMITQIGCSNHIVFSMLRNLFFKLRNPCYARDYCDSICSRELSQNQIVDFHQLSQNAVLISESKDIYENLAFEDWLYTNLNFTAKNQFFLLMWRNHPSVVIGRHQNPWTECSLDFCHASGISMARRNSGGGTVYHDLGNLNCSFMGPRNKYHRKNNLQIICDSIRRKWNINIAITERDDILLDGKYKISGTASKLGRTNAYHHCTFLIDADELKLKQALHRDKLCIKSRATSSIRGTVKNLKSVCSDLDIEKVIEVIKNHYQLIYNVPECNIFRIYPSEIIFPGIGSIVEHLKSWGWCFGHTPEFSVTKTFPICLSFSKWGSQNLPPDVNIQILIQKGLFEDIQLTPEILEEKSFSLLKKHVIGKQFSPTVEASLEEWTKLCGDKIIFKFLKSCVLQMVLDVLR